MGKTIKTKQDTPFQYEYVFDNQPWKKEEIESGDRVKKWSVPIDRPDIPGAEGYYNYQDTIFPAHGVSVQDTQQQPRQQQDISAERQRIMDSINRRAGVQEMNQWGKNINETPYEYNLEMPQKPASAQIDRQIEGRNAAGAAMPATVSPESFLQSALKRLMAKRGY